MFHAKFVLLEDTKLSLPAPILESYSYNSVYVGIGFSIITFSATIFPIFSTVSV
jgi:hypothetical protein